VGIAPATGTRFCKQFRFRNFADFKMKLAAELAASAGAVPQTYQDVVAGQSVSDMRQALETNHIRSISETSRLIDDARLDEAISLLERAGRIDIYGVATSGVVAADLHQKLVRIGKTA